MLENRRGQSQKLGGGASEGARTALKDVSPSSLLNRCIVRLTAVGLRSFSNNVIGDGLA